MGTTPKLAIPYVEPADRLADYPLADKAQADKLEALLLNTAPDTGWITGGSGGSIMVPDPTTFTLTNSYVRMIGKLVFVSLAGTMKVVKAINPQGDIGNTNLVQMVAAYRPTAPTSQSLSPGNSGRVTSSYIATTGWITLAAIGGTVDLAVGEAISISGVYTL